MKIKKSKGKPILARARKPAEAAAVTPAQRILRPVLERWRLIAVIVGAAAAVALAAGGYYWYVNDREDKATRAYARLQGKHRERLTAAMRDAGSSKAVDEDALRAARVADLQEYLGRYETTGAGRAATYELASLFYENGKFVEARALFEKVRRHSKGTIAALAWKGIGDCYRATDDYKNAIATYEVIYNRDPDGFPGVPVGMALAACYDHEGRTADAERIYRRVLDYNALSPYAPEAAEELAKLDQIRRGVE